MTNEMSEFANTPEMDWFTAVEQGADGGYLSQADIGGNAAPLSFKTDPGYQVQPQPFNGTSKTTAYDTLLGCQLDTTSISDANGPPTIEFKSGCRVIEYQEPKSRRKRQIEDPQGDRFVCLWSPCKSTKTFGRVAELQRHYDEQHVRSRVLDCMAVDCPAKGLRGFTRLNKLIIHLGTHHSKSTPFLCPVPQCDVGPFPPDLLYVHLHRHNYDVCSQHISQSLVLRAMCFSCPVQGCTAVPAWGYHRLDDHDIDTRKRNASAILSAGYSPTSGLPVCAVCNAELPSRFDWNDSAYTDHFSSHDCQSLYEYRREILRVWPWFGRRPEFQQVFEDILPTVDRTDIGTRG